MKKIIIGIIVLVVVIGIIVGMVLNINKKNNEKIEIERADGTFTDASLEYTIKDESIIKFNHMETKDDRIKGKLGRVYKEIYYFEGLKEGKTNIVFIIKDGAGNVSKKYEYDMVVDKNLNVKVISNND